MDKRIIRAKVRIDQPPKQSFLSANNGLKVDLLTVDESSHGQRLDNFLLNYLKGVPKTHVYRLIRSAQVRVNKGRAGVDTRLVQGDVVRVPPVRRPVPTQVTCVAPPREFEVVFEDEHVLVINKPAGVAVHGGSGVSFGVIEQLRQARPQARFLELVHRLDRETSGLLVVAKKRSALLHLQNQFRNREVDKTYAALVKGLWPSHQKCVDVALLKYLDPQGERRVKAVSHDHAEGRRAISMVQVVQDFGRFSLLDVSIKTGRTHQIRVHLSSLDHPIVGDPKYGDFALNKSLSRTHIVPSRSTFARMFLHARLLRFTHPLTLKKLELQAPLPAECVTFLEVLRSLKPDEHSATSLF